MDLGLYKVSSKTWEHISWTLVYIKSHPKHGNTFQGPWSITSLIQNMGTHFGDLGSYKVSSKTWKHISEGVGEGASHLKDWTLSPPPGDLE